MKAQQRIDRILEAVTKKIQDEVTALIGASLTLSESENILITKEEFFDQPLGKQVVAKLDVTGSVEGKGCLLVGVKDAIRLGGTLIMLPQHELEKVIANEEYNEETKDSFGEIANIIAGSYTKVFEEMYPDPCRFIRKEQDVLVPLKVDVDSDEPVPNQLYYRVASPMKLDDVEMGALNILLPAAAFGLERKDDAAPREQAAEQKPAAVEKEKIAPPPTESEERHESAPEPKKPAGPAFDIEKQRKRVDALLFDCCKKMQEEVGALLGVDVRLDETENVPVDKEGFFLDEVVGKQVLAHMKVTGDVEDKSYLFISLKDAIRIGGTMIMLPPFELDAAVAEEEFSEDAADAYGEIANIIAGVYTGFFEEQYVKSLRFVKTGLEQVVPLKVETAAAEPIPEQMYYMSSSAITMDGKALGKLRMLFPAALLQLEGLEPVRQPEAARQPDAAAAAEEHRPRETAGETAAADARTPEDGADILVISDDDRETEKIRSTLEAADYAVKVLSFKNNVNSFVSNRLKAVFLVMREVDEQAFGVAIKISSSCSAPLIAAGPAWTRSKVIKAVKYGVTDILLTPASVQDIQEKIANNRVPLAA